MLSREGGRDAALRFHMDAESCELAGGGEGNVVLEMEDDFSSRSQPSGGGEIGRVMGEGEGCESQELINAQRTVLTMERGGPDLRTAAGFGNSLSGGRGNGPPG